MSIEDSVKKALEDKKQQDEKMFLASQNKAKEYAERFYKDIHNKIVDEIVKTGNHSVKGSYSYPSGRGGDDYPTLFDEVISLIFKISLKYSVLESKRNNEETIIKNAAFDTFFHYFIPLIKQDNITVEWKVVEGHSFRTNNWLPAPSGTNYSKTHRIDINNFSSIVLPYSNCNPYIYSRIECEYSYIAPASDVKHNANKDDEKE